MGGAATEMRLCCSVPREPSSRQIPPLFFFVRPILFRGVWVKTGSRAMKVKGREERVAEDFRHLVVL